MSLNEEIIYHLNETQHQHKRAYEGTPFCVLLFRLASCRPVSVYAEVLYQY